MLGRVALAAFPTCEHTESPASSSVLLALAPVNDSIASRLPIALKASNVNAGTSLRNNPEPDEAVAESHEDMRSLP
jgi:hypothetical protein